MGMMMDAAKYRQNVQWVAVFTAHLEEDDDELRRVLDAMHSNEKQDLAHALRRLAEICHEASGHAEYVLPSPATR